mgnify:CR=1 FL=1
MTHLEATEELLNVLDTLQAREDAKKITGQFIESQSAWCNCEGCGYSWIQEFFSGDNVSIWVECVACGQQSASVVSTAMPSGEKVQELPF